MHLYSFNLKLGQVQLILIYPSGNEHYFIPN